MARLRTRYATDPDMPFDEVFEEPPLARRRRLDRQAKDGKRAVEVDRSGSVIHMERAAKRLGALNAADRVLRVPHWDMGKAIEAMQRAGVRGRVTNLGDSVQKRPKSKRH
ncbi:MAG: hypothetical protein IV086_06130 [Hyphomonadaceae bacterium]|nr:MAG: response regulator receiver [Caulobacteraceae bacterium]MBT9445258.1 hypothetical protein [Hyphomonadaceae bacterium]TPW07959.1 MAG: response regulator receiver protein [Alphaproteobacteria bacterium]